MPESQLEKDALARIAEAKADRQKQEAWLRDVYKFAMPNRRRFDDSEQAHDQDELFDGTAIEALDDFAADMQNTFTPIEEPWVSVEPANKLTPPQRAEIKDAVKAYGESLFAEIRRSNFHEAAQEAYPDLGHGTMAMCINDLDINEPIHCLAIPATDLLITRGIYGGVDARIRCLKPKLSELEALYPKATIPAKVRQKKDKNTRAEVYECHWRLYDQTGIQRYQYALLIEKEAAFNEMLQGAGSCSLIAARWKTDSTTAWGAGPLYKVLPTIKTADQLAYLILKALNLHVAPIIAYDNDGTINVENGASPGDWIPKEPGSKIEVIESKGTLDSAFFERVQMQSDIRKALFQDKPDQRGKTPPSASQWVDERADMAIKMGAPFGRLVSEWQYAVVERFAYLLKKRGVLPEVKLGGDVVTLRPQSPLVKMQRQQQVVIADRFLELGNARFGEEAMGMEVNMSKTLENIKDRLGADIIVLNTSEEKKAILAAAAEAAKLSGQLPTGAAA